jgi:hypothetical protein
VIVTFNNHTFTIIHKTNKKIKRISIALENKDEIVLKTPLGLNGFVEILTHTQEKCLKRR